MFKEINNLKPFFDEPLKEYNIREYARIIKVSPATAMKYLSEYEKNKIIKSRRERNLVLYKANNESDLFLDLKRFYNIRLVKESGVIDYLNDAYLYPKIILFGSFAKADNNVRSDIDLCVISKEKKEVNLEKFEKKIKHKIQIFNYTGIEEIKNDHLKNNIIEGIVL